MGNFVIKSKLKLHELSIGEKLSESDFCCTSGDYFVQMDYKEEKHKQTKYSVEPGVWSIKKTMEGLKLVPTEFSKDRLLDSFIHTKAIEKRIDKFFERLHVYKEFGIDVPRRTILLYGPPGCHAKGTKILMFDGSIKNVEDIKVGDELMGPDSTARKVLDLASGKEEMLKVTPTKGDPFVVNVGHLFYLTPSHKNESVKFPIVVSGRDLIQKATGPFKERFKLTRTSVDFKEKHLVIPPYILGLWLGDGTQNEAEITSMDQEIIDSWGYYGKSIGLNIREEIIPNNKAKVIHLVKQDVTIKTNPFLVLLEEYNLRNNRHIPFDYLTSSKSQRLELLAGLMDTDGSLSCDGYDYIAKNKNLAEQVVYLSRSLGLAAYLKECQKGCGYKGEYREGTYYRVSISGDTNMVPCRLSRKQAIPRQQIKNVLRTGFTFETLPENNYYGFSLDKDHLYLTADFTIHHNTGKTAAISKVVEKYSADKDYAIIIWKTDVIDPHEAKEFIKSFNYDGVKKLIMVAEDIGGVEMDQVRIQSESSLLSLLDNQEKAFTIPVMIIATTNYPENLLSNLTNRPQRIDDKIEIGYPKGDERAKLFKFFAGQRRLKKHLYETLKTKSFDSFTPAHIKEIFVRSAIYDISLRKAMEQIRKEIDHFNNLFQNKIKLGIAVQKEDYYD